MAPYRLGLLFLEKKNFDKEAAHKTLVKLTPDSEALLKGCDELASTSENNFPAGKGERKLTENRIRENCFRRIGKPPRK